MNALDLKSVPQWIAVANKWCPQSVDTFCPNCNRLVNFVLNDYNWDAPRHTIAASGRCPGCRSPVYFWVIEPGPADDRSQKGCACLAIYPAPGLPREPAEWTKLMPDGLRKAYLQVLAAYNAGVWTATGTLCRRALEGVVNDLVPPQELGGTLYQNLQKLGGSPDLGGSLLRLSHALREGGNISSHFDPEREPDASMAEKMLNLTEYLLEYVYALPMMIEDLSGKLAAAGEPGERVDRSQ